MSVNAELHSMGFVTAKLILKRYSISNSTLYNWIAAGYFPKPIRVGPRASRFRIEDIQQFERDVQAGSCPADISGVSAEFPR